MTAPARELIDDCIHCGFCLPYCPTYQNWSEEMDSPRGRIDLMRGLRAGTIELTPTVVSHFDRCLGCMGCMTACPSGVRYDVLIEETRAHIEDAYQRDFVDRFQRWLMFQIFPYPARLRVVAATLVAYTGTGARWLAHQSGLIKLLPPRLRQLEALQPPVTLRNVFASLPRHAPAKGPSRARVALLAGCVQRIFNPSVNDATIRVLTAEGCDVVVPGGQGCCGALSMHAGRKDQSLQLTRELIETLSREDVDVVVVNAAGCGSHLKETGRLFPDDPKAQAFAAKVRDVTEFLATLPPQAPRRPLNLQIAMHDACHLAHAQRIKAQPRAILSSIPGVKLVEIPDGDQCCGSAGVYNLLQADSADQIGQRKVDNILSTRTDLLASANPGCTLQIQKVMRERGKPIAAAHPVEILDASISGTPLPQ